MPVAVRRAEKHQEDDIIGLLSHIDSMHVFRPREWAFRCGLNGLHWPGVRAAVFGMNTPTHSAPG